MEIEELLKAFGSGDEFEVELAKELAVDTRLARLEEEVKRKKAAILRELSIRVARRLSRKHAVSFAKACREKLIPIVEGDKLGTRRFT